jgi:hypothetical protein
VVSQKRTDKETFLSQKGKERKVNEEKVRSLFTLLSIKIIQGKIIIIKVTITCSKLFVVAGIMKRRKGRKEGNMSMKMTMKKVNKNFFSFQ